MSNLAWEITDEDIAHILSKHKNGADIDGAEIDTARAALDEDKVISGLLHYTDMDDQTQSANSDIEDQLMSAGIIPKAEKLFKSP